MNDVSISLVLTVEIGGDSINRTLDGLSMQQLPHGASFEMLVVDCQEQPQPRVGWPFTLRWLSQPKESFGYAQQAIARNRGLREARGEILIFLEEGLLVGRDFVEQHWAYHQSEQHLCVVGARSLLQKGDRPDSFVWANHLEESPVEGLTIRWLEEKAPWALVDGANFSLRRADLHQIGGYDSEYAVYETGNAELGYRLWKAGLRVVYSQACKAFYTPLTTYPKTRWRGEGVDYLHYKHAELVEWARARQALVGLRDHNFYTTEQAVASEVFLKRLEGRLPGSNKNFEVEPQFCLAIVVRDQNGLFHALSDLARRAPTLPPFEVLVLDVTPPGATHQVERITRTIQVPFPIYYHPVNGLDVSDRMPSCWEKGTRLSRLLLEGVEHEIGKQRRSIQELARCRAHAPILLMLEPAEIEQVLADYPVPNRGTEQQLPDQRPVQRCVASNSKEWQSGSIAQGYSYPPRTVSFKLTNLCNLRCEMCGQWGPKGNVFSQDKTALRDQMNLAELRMVIDQVASFHSGMIYIWGGEPFLHPDFLEFIAYIRSKRLYCLINTNGTRLQETAQDLVAIGPQYLRVSLDGPPPIHDRIRGRAGTFDQVVKGIQVIDRLKREQERLFPIVEVDCTISKSNYDCLEELLFALEGTGVFRVAYSHLVYVPQQVGESHQRLFRQLFDCEAEHWRGFVQDTAAIDTDILSQVVTRLQGRKQGIPVTFDPPMRSPADIALHYRDAASLYHNRYCCAPWLWAEVHANGDVAFCDDFPDYVLGNVCQTPFLSIWNGERARRFRRELLAHKRFPICTHCGFLHHDPTF